MPEGHDVENKTVMHRLSRLREMVSEAAGVGAWGRTFQVWVLLSPWGTSGGANGVSTVQTNSRCPN